jgi:hypothetical protein
MPFMKKRIIQLLVLVSCVITSSSVNAQYYPGGFPKSKISLWYDAADTTTFTRTSNDSTLTKWTDKSNGIVAAQTTSAYQPVLSTQNGKNIVEFTNLQQLIIPATSLLAPSNGYDIAQVVYVYPDASTGVMYSAEGTFSVGGTNSNQGYPNIGIRYNTYNNENKYEVTACRNNTGYYYQNYNDLRGQWLIPSNYTPGNLPSNSSNAYAYYYYNGTGTLSSNGALVPTGTPTGTIGNHYYSVYDSVHWGVSETVLAGFDTKVSGRRIIDFYLATKWGMLDTLNTYIDTALYYPTNTAFVNDLVGIGTEGGSDSISYTGSNDGLGFQNVNGTTGFLRSAGSYIMAADNKLTGTVAEGSGGFNRWNRSWFIDKTDASGYGGLVNVYFDFTNYGVTLDTTDNSYYLLYNPTNGYFNSGTNYLVSISSYTVNPGTNQFSFLVDGINLSNGYYTIVYAPKGSNTATIPYIGTFTPASVSVSPAPTLTSVFAGNTYNYLFIDSTALTYPVAYTKIYVSVNGGASTAIDSVTGVPSYVALYNLTNGSTYAYTVTAVYAPGKESVQSNSITAIPNQFTPSWGTLPQYAGSGAAYMSASTPGSGLPIKFNFKDITKNDSSGYQANNYYTESSLTNGNTYTYEFMFYDSTQGLSTASNWSAQESVFVADSTPGGFTYNLSFLDPTTIWAPNGIGPSTNTPATENMTGLREVEHAAAIGVHPRVFINPEDSTSIRWRLANTYSGKSAAHWIHDYTTILNLGYGTLANNGGRFTGTWSYTGYYNLDTLGNEYITNGGAWTVQPYYNYLAAGDTSTNSTYNYSTLWNGNGSKMTYLFAQEAMECWLYRNQTDPATGLNYATRAQKLASAITTWAKEALANTTTPLNATNASQFGGANMYYVYDFLFDQMTTGQQDTVRMALMAMLPDSTEFHGLEAASYTATSNWLSFPQGVTYFFAVEGEPGYTAEDTATVNHYMRSLWNFLTYGVYSQTGNVYEAIGKDQLDVPDLYAAAKRGYSMLGHPSVKAYGTKYLPALVQPFGYSFLGTDLLGGTQSITGYPNASSPSTGGWRQGFCDVEGLKWIFPNDTAVDYVWKNYMQRPLANSPYNSSLSPNFYFYTDLNDNYGGGGVGENSYFNTRISGLLFASDYFSASLSTEAQYSFYNNKMYFDSLGGFATLRSGFDSTATTVFFANRQDMGGHTYANKNEVVLSAQGRIWFPRPSSNSNSLFDALAATGVGSASGILVNNYGGTIDTSASSADGGNLSVPGKIVYFQDSTNMLSIAGDATIPYSYKWYGQFGGWTGANPNLSPPSITAVSYSANSFRYSPFYSFDNTSYYNKLSFSDQAFTQPSYLRYAQKASTPNGVYTKMFRTVSLIQATKPYVIIADDDQLNTSSNDYKWFCQLPSDVTIASTAVNSSSTNYQNDIILKEASGNRRLLVRVLNNNGAISSTVPGVLDSTTYSLSGLNRLIVESNSVDPQFKVLLFAYNNGDSLPITSWNSDKSKLYVYNNGVTNTIAFSLNTSGRTTITLNPTDTAYYWTGAQDSLWNNPNNWSTGLVPTSSTAVIIPNIDVTTLQNAGTPSPNDNSSPTTTSNEYYPYISGFTAYATTLTIDSGAYIRIDSTLQLSGNVICYGTTKGNGYLKTTSISTTPFTPNTTWGVNIEYNDSVGGQTVVGGNYKSLSINATQKPSLFTASGNITVADTLNLTVGDTLNMGTDTLGGKMLVSTGTGTLKTQSTSSTDLPSGGVTWAGHVNYNNTNGVQTIQNGTYANLLVSNLYNNDTANGNINVNDTLNLAYRSSLDMKTYQLGGMLNTVTGSGSLRTANTSATGALPANEIWAGTVVYYSTSSQVIAPGTYSNIDISGGSNGPRIFCGVLDPTDTIKLTGSFTPTTGTTTPLKSTVIFEGNGQTVPASSFYNLSLVGSTATQFYNGTINIYGAFLPGSITSTGGTGTGTISFTDTSTVKQSIPSFNYNSLTITGADKDSVVLGSTIGVTGNLSLSGLSFSSGSLVTTGSTITLNGTAAQSIYGLSTIPFNNIIISNTAANVTATDSLSLTGNLQVSTGATLDMSTYNLDGSFALATGTGNAGTIKTQSVSTAPLPTGLTYSGTVYYYSTTGTQTIVGGTYSNLNISGGTTGGRILANGQTINVSGSYTVNSGTGAVTVTGNTINFNGTTTISGATSFNNVTIAASSALTAPSGTLNIAGNFTNNGTFNANSGTVVLNGSNQTVTGSNTFNNLTMAVTSPATLTLPSSQTQTINGALILTGTLGNIITLNASTPGTQAFINPTGTRTIKYVLVKDNNNSNATVITATSSYNNGDNTNWNFSAASYTWTGASDTRWNNPANWNTTVVPGNADTVIIGKTGSNDLSLEVSPTCASFTVNSSNNVSFNSQVLTLTGNYTNNGTVNGNGSTIVFGGTTTTSGSGTNYWGNVTINASSTLTAASASTFYVAGNWTDNGTFAPSTGTINFDGTAAQSITKSGGETFYNLSVNNTAATVSAGSNITVGSTAATTLTIASGAILDMTTYQLLAYSLTNSGTGTIKTANTSTTPFPTGKTWTDSIVYYNTTGGQTVMAGTYNHSLTSVCNTSGTRSANTASGNLAIVGTLSLTDSLNMGTSIITTSSSFTPIGANGVLETQAGTTEFPYNYTWPGTVEFNGTSQRIIAGIYNNINASIGGNKNLTDNSGSANNVIQVNGTFNIADATNTYPNSSTVIFAGTNQVIPGINYNNLTITGTGSTFGSSSAAIINIAGAFTPGSVTSANQGTINFNGTATQTIPLFNYANLTISGSRGGATGINGTATNGSTVLYNVTNNSNIVVGDTLTSATASFPAGTVVTANNSSTAVAGLAGTIYSGNNKVIAVSTNTGITSNMAVTTGAPAGTLVSGTNGAVTTATGTWASGATTITVSSNTGLVVGMIVTGGTGLQSNTTVTNISGTTLTISPATTAAQSSSASLSFSAIITLSANATGGATSFSFSPAIIMSNAYTGTSGTYTDIVAKSTLTYAAGTIGVAGNFSDSHTGTISSTINTGSTVNMTGSAATLTASSGSDFKANISITNNSTVSAGGYLTFNGVLNVASGSTLNMGTNYLYAGSGFSNTGLGTIQTQNTNSTAPIPTGQTWSGTVQFNATSSQTVVAGSYNNIIISGTRTSSVTLASGTINIAGNYTRSATFSAGSLQTSGNTLVFNGTSNQTITAATAETFNNVTINNTTTGADTIKLSTSNFTINGTLALTSGYLSLGSSNLTVAAMPTGASSSYIVTGSTGVLTKNSVSSTAVVFPVGTTTSYAPITVANTTGTSNISVGVSPTITNTVNTPTQVINLQWSVTGSAATTASMTYQFNTVNEASGFVVANTCDLGIYTSSYAISSVGTPSGSNPYTLSKTGISLASGTNYLFVVGNTGSIGCVAGSYTGANGGNANLASNWCNSVLPTSSTNVVIATNAPQLTANLSVNNMSLSSSINLNGYMLTINGAISGTGVITGSPTSSLTLAGSASGTIYFNQTSNDTTNALNNLVINTSGTITLGNSLNIIGTVTPTTGTLTTGNNLTLISSSAGTARIDQVLGTISGNVTVQRYIPAKSSREFSYIGSSISQSIRNAWQQQIYITGSGSGGVPCGSTTGDGVSSTDKYNTNGFDVTQTNYPSMFIYNSTKVNGTHYVSVQSTDQTNLAPGTGYVINIRGNRNSSTVTCVNQLETGTPTAPEAVTLIENGTIVSGPKAVSLYDTSLSKYTLIANPYPSQISYTAFQVANSTNLYNKMWTYSPTGGAGNYTTYIGGSSPVIANPATGYDGTSGDRLASGQAFFVEATKAGSAGTVTFQEAHKTSGVIPNTQYFGTNAIKMLRIALKTSSGNPLDDIVVRFAANGTKDTYNPEMDAESFDAGSQVIKTIKGTRLLAISTLPDSITIDTALLDVASNANGTFELYFSDYQNIDSSVAITLIDNFLGNTQDVRSNQTYLFNVTSDSASQGKNRFAVIFNGASALPVNFTNVSATKNNNGVGIKWSVANEANIVSYGVERATDGINFSSIATAKASSAGTYSVEDDKIPTTASTLYYRIKSVAWDGSYKYSNVVSVKLCIANSQLSIYPNPVQEKLNIILGAVTNSIYKVRILAVSGVEVFSKAGIAANGNTISIDATSFVAGVYIVELTDEIGNKQLEKFVKE